MVHRGGLEMGGLSMSTLISQKEQEVVGLREQRLRVLEETLLDRDEELAIVKGDLASLKEDFKYNLR
eukprot:5214361-Pyramimonas_sp.AAC.1